MAPLTTTPQGGRLSNPLYVHHCPHNTGRPAVGAGDATKLNAYWEVDGAGPYEAHLQGPALTVRRYADRERDRSR
jgi:hypothetical protein